MSRSLPVVVPGGRATEGGRPLSGPVPFSFQEFDLDDARAAIATNYFPTTLDLHSARSPYRFRFDGHARGPLTVGHAWYTSGMRIGIEEVGSVYVNFPTRGTMRSRHRHHEVDIEPGKGSVFRPSGAVEMATSNDYSSMAVKIELRVLEDALEDILGRPVPGHLELAPALDLNAAPGAAWARLVRFLVAESHPGGLAENELVAAPMHEALVHGLLLAVDHPYRDALHAPTPSFAPSALRHVVDAIQADPSRDLTLSGMARLARVSVRTLQEMFRRHLDTTPTEYVRQIRLERAHEELRTADPASTTISRVASRWGFAHTGRFAAAYRTRYGMPPSVTLRRGPRS